MNNLSEKGYVVLRNLIDINLGTDCIKNNKLDYKCIYNIINRKYFPVITSKIPNSDNASFRRFIFSNSSYASMDMLYHANSYNHTNTNEIPIYCAYLFFSSATLEIIPGSHIKTNKMSYESKYVLNLNEGDVVLLNTNLHNRTISSDSTKILKLLDIFPNDEVKNIYSHNLVVAQMNNSLIVKYILFSLIFLSKVKIFMEIANFFHYYLVYYNIQYKFLLEKFNTFGKLASYEGNGRLYLDEIKSYESWNTYIICSKNINTEYFGNNLTLILAIFAVLYGTFIYFSCKNKTAKECYLHLFDEYTPNYIKDFLTRYKINPLINDNILFT